MIIGIPLLDGLQHAAVSKLYVCFFPFFAPVLFSMSFPSDKEVSTLFYATVCTITIYSEAFRDDAHPVSKIWTTLWHNRPFCPRHFNKLPQLVKLKSHGGLFGNRNTGCLRSLFTDRDNPLPKCMRKCPSYFLCVSVYSCLCVAESVPGNCWLTHTACTDTAKWAVCAHETTDGDLTHSYLFAAIACYLYLSIGDCRTISMIENHTNMCQSPSNHMLGTDRKKS